MGVVLVFHRSLNDPNHSIDVFHHIVIPESNHLIAQRLKVLCSFRVVLGLIYVLASIQLDDELLFDTAEIGDKVTNGMLTSKIHP